MDTNRKFNFRNLFVKREQRKLACSAERRKGRMKSNLICYQKGRVLVKEVYALVKTFPVEEKYALGDQMRRAVVSVTSNIAEGSGHFRMFVVEKRFSNGGGNKIGFDEFMIINEAGMEVEIKERTKELT